MLVVEGLRKEFPGVLAVSDLSFSIGRGVVCGFIGPNGAGKTTTMRMISTLDTPTRGRVWVDGHSIYRDPYAVRRRIGFMPDHLGVYPDMTVDDYLEFYARAYDLPFAVRKSRLPDIMAFTELDQVAAKKVETLSKGWRQRLNLGRALVNDPSLLVMDEPAAGLDPRARIELRLLIRELARRGKTVFISSHILSELAEICDELLIIEHGKLVTQGTAKEIRRRATRGHAIHIATLGPPDREKLEHFLLERRHIVGVSWDANNTAILDFTGEQADAADLLQALVHDGFRLVEFRIEAPSMEDVFMQITTGGA